ncbi:MULTISPECIES: phospho-sugar mutase [Pseudobutyrivibrio]|uniref:phosphoglucomutase (alpha-D-glucose-1,6-bisphosphate-dependent) n=1 Tax=Pseudobutyrivibrio ruminis TaxID=46206 RepID=A0A2G3DYC5_9FIRM|nr:MULTISPECIES: phospho-sugar mutase [Pseudobutyrivibrio]MBE5903099.1 phospho-sugar mutase [Pseudobutyrivibrio sp.]PHU35883.1 phospho-sugar mutase [Pseudobutyrivibrio ruminis]SCY02217.1 phosphoglucomutase [Pseudobutyrivibrio sp. AR14]
MDYNSRYNEWLEHLLDSDPLKAELLSIKDDEKDKEDRFYQDLSFGTAGLRGKVGAGTNRMNFFTVGKATQGVADFIVSKGKEAMEKGVVIAHDPRHFSKEFSQLAAGIFAANGIKVYVFPDLRPTPELAFMIRRLGTVSGINITASHNPKEYNGYKAYWDDGCQVSSEIADGMYERIKAVDIWSGVKKSDFEEGVKSGKIIVLGEEFDREYLDKIESLAIHEGDELDLTIPLVYTPLNGCGSIPFRQMLNDRGFSNWTIVPEQENPDPDFTTVGYPNPEDPKAFKLSEEYGRKFGAELLMATDPDADRFAIEIRDSQGNYVPLNGNQTGYLLVNYVLEGHKDAGTLPAKGAMVKSIVTSTLSTIMAKAYGVEMFETLTGFKNICGKIPYLHDNGYTYLFGYEESVGYAICEDIRDKDGISAGMMVAEAAAYYRKQGKTLWDVLQEIYAKYGFFAEDEPNIILEGIPGAQRIQRMMKWFRDNIPTEVAGSKVEKVIDYINGYEDIPPQNAIRIFLENGSWFAIRPSGTEPKIKFYFYSNQDSRENALKVNASIKEEIFALINSVE